MRLPPGRVTLISASGIVGASILDASAITALAGELANCATAAEIVRVVRDAVRRLVDADGALIAMRDGDSWFYADDEAIAPPWRGKRIRLDAGLVGWMSTRREHAIVRDVETDLRVVRGLYQPAVVKSLVMMSMRPGHPVGAVGAYWAHVHETTAIELAIVRAISGATADAFTGLARRGDSTGQQPRHDPRRDIG